LKKSVCNEKEKSSMSRLQDLFKQKKERVLNMYCTAGFPELDSTLAVMQTLQECGADIIELGMPYSDPLADGPIIQASASKALANGMTITTLFRQLKDFRKSVHIPVVLMGYMNPVLQYGFERFCADAANIGIDGLILPDLPLYEWEMEYGPILKKHNLDFIFLVTPETSEARIRKLDAASSGFLYAVSASATTGGTINLAAMESYLKRLHAMHLKNPILVGFGIKDKQTFETACRYTQGAIIASAYIRELEKSTDVKTTTQQFLNAVLAP
jgi:tryptophan synthase alpha chain